MKSYRNRWITKEVIEALAGCDGRILDIGGGIAPYRGADMIVDLLPYDREQLTVNAWPADAGKNGQKYKGKGAKGSGEVYKKDEKDREGAEQEVESSNSESLSSSFHLSPGTLDDPRPRWTRDQYLQMDICDSRLPFAPNAFDVVLCSHLLQDVEDPVSVLRELSRVAKRVVVVAPSRLLEQTWGVVHPRRCGITGHKWMLEEEDGSIVFTRKTVLVERHGAHIFAPPGKTLKRSEGVFFHSDTDTKARVRNFASEAEELKEMRGFISSCRNRSERFEVDDYRHGLKYWLWRMKQVIFEGRGPKS